MVATRPKQHRSLFACTELLRLSKLRNKVALYIAIALGGRVGRIRLLALPLPLSFVKMFPERGGQSSHSWRITLFRTIRLAPCSRGPMETSWPKEFCCSDYLGSVYLLVTS